MPTDPLGYAQNAFDAAFRETEKARSPVRWSSIFRRAMAYCLKAIAVFGGLAISTGRVAPYAQEIGIAIAAAVAIDGLFSNYVRMMLVTKAAQAYKRLVNEARRSHTRRLAPILAIKEAQPAESQQQLLALLDELTGKLHSGCTNIETALDDGHIKALETLSLDSERTKPTVP